jgi:hypothetical protein
LQKIVNHPDLLIPYFKRLGITGKQKSKITEVVDLENDSQESILIDDDDEIFDLNEDLSDSKSESTPKKIGIPVKNIDTTWANAIFDEGSFDSLLLTI